MKHLKLVEYLKATSLFYSFHSLKVSILCFLLSSCASESFNLPGGDQDDKGPVINEFKYDSSKKRISIIFNEYITTNTNQLPYIIQPYVPGIESNIKGKRINFHIPDTVQLIEQQYYLNIKNYIKDVNEGNAYDSTILVLKGNLPTSYYQFELLNDDTKNTYLHFLNQETKASEKENTFFFPYNKESKYYIYNNYLNKYLLAFQDLNYNQLYDSLEPQIFIELDTNQSNYKLPLFSSPSLSSLASHSSNRSYFHFIIKEPIVLNSLHFPKNYQKILVKDSLYLLNTDSTLNNDSILISYQYQSKVFSNKQDSFQSKIINYKQINLEESQIIMNHSYLKIDSIITKKDSLNIKNSYSTNKNVITLKDSFNQFQKYIYYQYKGKLVIDSLRNPEPIADSIHLSIYCDSILSKHIVQLKNRSNYSISYHTLLDSLTLKIPAGHEFELMTFIDSDKNNKYTLSKPNRKLLSEKIIHYKIFKSSAKIDIKEKIQVIQH